VISGFISDSDDSPRRCGATCRREFLGASVPSCSEVSESLMDALLINARGRTEAGGYSAAEAAAAVCLGLSASHRRGPRRGSAWWATAS
jgi:hypothetical protein